jgi:hypothetical protein
MLLALAVHIVGSIKCPYDVHTFGNSNVLDLGNCMAWLLHCFAQYCASGNVTVEYWPQCYAVML